MKKLYFLMIFCAIFILSCSKHRGGCLPDNELVGSWEWVRTDGGIAGHIHKTPASTGNRIKVQFTAGNTYAFYTNGVLTSQGTYSLEVRNCIHDHSNKNVINFSSSQDPDMMIEKLNSSLLELSDDAYDGLTSMYTKM
jgi:hypothetical protein